MRKLEFSPAAFEAINQFNEIMRAEGIDVLALFLQTNFEDDDTGDLFLVPSAEINLDDPAIKKRFESDILACILDAGSAAEPGSLKN